MTLHRRSWHRISMKLTDCQGKGQFDVKFHNLKLSGNIEVIFLTICLIYLNLMKPTDR